MLDMMEVIAELDDLNRRIHSLPNDQQVVMWCCNAAEIISKLVREVERLHRDQEPELPFRTLQ